MERLLGEMTTARKDAQDIAMNKKNPLVKK